MGIGSTVLLSVRATGHSTAIPSPLRWTVVFWTEQRRFFSSLKLLFVRISWQWWVSDECTVKSALEVRCGSLRLCASTRRIPTIHIPLWPTVLILHTSSCHSERPWEAVRQHQWTRGHLEKSPSISGLVLLPPALLITSSCVSSPVHFHIPNPLVQCLYWGYAQCKFAEWVIRRASITSNQKEL